MLSLIFPLFHQPLQLLSAVILVISTIISYTFAIKVYSMICLCDGFCHHFCTLIFFCCSIPHELPEEYATKLRPNAVKKKIRSLKINISHQSPSTTFSSNDNIDSPSVLPRLKLAPMASIDDIIENFNDLHSRNISAPVMPALNKTRSFSFNERNCHLDVPLPNACSLVTIASTSASTSTSTSCSTTNLTLNCSGITEESQTATPSTAVNNIVICMRADCILKENEEADAVQMYNSEIQRELTVIDEEQKSPSKLTHKSEECELPERNSVFHKNSDEYIINYRD